MLLNYAQTGSGSPVVLLHGLAGSLRYWDSLLPELSQSNSAIALDLLGFGRSPKPSSVTYTYETHLASIAQTLRHIGINTPFHLVGHSTGALLALRLAARSPELVDRLSLISMPVYSTASEARRDITRGKKLRDLAYYGPTSRLLCTAWCKLLRPLSRSLAPHYLPNLPKPIAADSILHTWQSYSQTLEHVVMHQNVQADLSKLRIPANIIYGDQESPLVTANFHKLKLGRSAKVHVIPGRHNIVIDNPAEVLKLIGS